jgi:hypothetical protein
MNQEKCFKFTLDELIDRLSVAQIKEILLLNGGGQREYITKLEQDIDKILTEKEIPPSGNLFKYVALIAIANMTVWRNKDDMGKLDNHSSDYLTLLEFAQEVNSIKNMAKNRILAEIGDLTSATARATFFRKSDKIKWYDSLLKKLTKDNNEK